MNSVKSTWQCIPFAIKQFLRIRRLGNSIFVKSNIKVFVEFTNGSLSRKFAQHGTFCFNNVKELELSHSCAKRHVRAWGRFFSTVIWNLRLYAVWDEKIVGLSNLLHSEVVTCDLSKIDSRMLTDVVISVRCLFKGWLIHFLVWLLLSQLSLFSYSKALNFACACN